MKYPLFLFSCSALVVATGCNKAPDTKYNIVYIMTDDHAQQMISCYGSTIARTPNIDSLAAHGVIFTNSFVANSISGPSRACMLTGKHSHANGKIDNLHSFDGEQQTMPKLLQQGGYTTAIIGKWHLESTPTGFDYWEILPGQGDYYHPDFITPQGIHRQEGYVTDIITDKAIDWLKHRDTTKPFALFVHHKAPHRNWMPNLADITYMEENDVPLPDSFFDNYSGRIAAASAEMRIGSDYDMDLLYDNKVYTGGEKSRLVGSFNINDTTGAYGRMKPEEKARFNAFYRPIIDELYARKLSGKALAEWKFQRYVKDYRKVIKSVDDNIGRLMSYLKENNLLENTIIVYTSDQGFYMGEHGWFDKRFMYEESMRTPLIMQLPATLKSRGKIDKLVQNIDYAPTFLQLAGIEVPTEMQGISLRPLLEGKNPSWRTSLYYHYQEYPAEHAVKRHYGIRTHRYKLIRFYNDIDTWELYDLENDPQEMKNIIDDKEQQQTVTRLKKELIRLQLIYNDSIQKQYPIVI